MLLLLSVQKLVLFVCVPIGISIPFYYFNRWLIRTLKPSEGLGKLLIYCLVILPVALVLITLCIYIILRGYWWMQKD